MAVLQVITPEELEARSKKLGGRTRSGRRRSPERTRIIEEYKSVLQQGEPGYGVDVSLSEGEDKRIVRQNLKAAAEELGKALDFRPIKEPMRIHCRIITLEEKAAKPPRGGRPRKTAQAEETPEQAALEATPAKSRRGRKSQAEVS